MWKIALVIVVVIASGVAIAHLLYRHAMTEAVAAMASIVERARPPMGQFDIGMVADLPEVAQRYFTHAIPPGTSLLTTVQLRMKGQFLLGDRQAFQTYDLEALQVLAPPGEFVWLPRMRSGRLHISGSDGLVQGNGWTRFWILGLVPVVNQAASSDLNRSALTRAAMEAVWAPASLLPANGVKWEQIGPDTARVTVSNGAEPMDITLGPDGEVLELVSMRWSNENADRTFRLQPFGGTAEAESRFGGFTIPTRMKIATTTAPTITSRSFRSTSPTPNTASSGRFRRAANPHRGGCSH